MADHRDVRSRDDPRRRVPQRVSAAEGTQVVIYNVFNHRNRKLIPYADRFSPASG